MSEMTKCELRSALRKQRRDHVAAQPDAMRALLFRHPPGPALDLIRPEAVIGLYRHTAWEAPTSSYAAFFIERGHRLALPRFEDRGASMNFSSFMDPFGEADLETGPFGVLQPAASAQAIQPDLLFVPLIGFTDTGARLGQGGGHYDRWLAEHSDTRTIGLAWDCQLVDELPQEAHDRPLDAVVTPTRMYGPFR